MKKLIYAALILSLSVSAKESDYEEFIKSDSVIGFIKNNTIDKTPKAWCPAEYNTNKAIDIHSKNADKER